MSLTARQIRFYTDTVNIYVPSNFNATRIGVNDVQALVYPTTPTYSNIKCFRKTNSRLGKGHFYGREKQDTTTANFEEVHFDCIQDIDATYVYQVVGDSSDKDYHEWYFVVQEPDINNFHANTAIVFVKKTTKPPGVT